MSEERRFILRNEFVLKNVLAFIAKLSGEWEIIVRPYVEKRSVAANARLWALHGLAAEHTGYSAEEMHEHALCRHYGYTEREIKDPFTGEILTKRMPLKRSSARNKKEFGAFMEATESWYISEFGVWLDQESVPVEQMRRAA